jgi:TatD DNase family protein
MVERLPREQLLLETDCPYLGPVRGELNEPANVAGTAEYVAQVWGCSQAADQEQLSENFATLFGVAP